LTTTACEAKAPAAAPPAAARGRWAPAVRSAAAAFWVRAFFWASQHAPGAVAGAGGVLCRGTFRCSASIRNGTRANARRLLGAGAPAGQVDALARRILSSFYLVCCDVGRSFSATRDELFARVEGTEREDRYQSARAAGKGVIVVTAHMGSFESGLAALRAKERAKIHVVFRRDPFERFERLRSDLRRRLGVEEAPVDDGWTVWMRLRDALLADEVVVLQGDRVMPGQRGEPVPFLGGTLLLPLGPVKMALATGAPIVPIFSVRTAEGKVRLFVEEPIHVAPDDSTSRGGPHPALLQWAAVLERYVRAYPDQWLMLQPALREDAGDRGTVETRC
jgi:KDO2-lipid IV(A) lauroyltransferase